LDVILASDRGPVSCTHTGGRLALSLHLPVDADAHAARLLAAYASCGGFGLEPLVFPEADTPATTTT
jgi:hypothetical protein